MKDFSRKDLLFSLCGLNCGLCTMRLGGYCPGCGGGTGNQSCKLARCSLEHGGVAYCSECPEFPCQRYEGKEEYDSFITTRNYKRDLEKQRRMGAEAYRTEQLQKVEILQKLLAECNDGRKKTLFALAVNLLEVEDLQAVLRKLEPFADAPIKEKAKLAQEFLQECAGVRGVVLKLRRKK